MPLELKDISFHYPRSPVPIVADISLRVEQGESVAIMAPSGSGKSTLLALAGGMLRPGSGTRELTTTRAGREPIVSWVFQSTNLLPRRTALDNAVIPAVSIGVERSVAEDEARLLLNALGVGNLESRLANSLSGGEAQRVGVARALVNKPDLLLADEPTANLDVRTARVVSSCLFEVARGAAFLIATHDEEVASMADRTFDLLNESSR